jgi:membrane protein implicated in regulation of membrane protease activity
MEFFNNLDTLLQVLWYVAIPTSVIFIIQTIMTFIGADATDGTEADFHGDFDGADAPFQLFSLRNLINFLLGFSWTGISFYNTISNHFILIALSLLVGLVFVFFFFMIIRQVQKLAEDNSFKIENTINKLADVYLPIPEHNKGKGKVLVSVGGSTRELDAITSDERIEVGTVVRIKRVENGNILVVEKIKN